MALFRPYPCSRRWVLSEVGYLCTFVGALIAPAPAFPGLCRTCDVRVFSHHIQVDGPQPVFAAFGWPEPRHGGSPEKVFEACRRLVANRDCEHVGTTYVYQLPVDTPPATPY